jgi:hypothetical protein
MADKLVNLEQRRTIKTRVEKQLERQAEEQRRKLLKNRVQIAREGATYYQRKHFPEACKKYYQYLYILEIWKKCKKNELSPSLFDVKKDIYELVLIAGVYWDLARLYDRAKRKDQKEELRNNLKYFVLFSKGLPFQKFSAQALRKYLQGGHCHHTLEFKEAYKQLSNERCFMVTSLLDLIDLETLERYRDYRDQVLSHSFLGRGFIQVYYKMGPSIAKALDYSPQWIRVCISKAIELFSPNARGKSQS